MRYLNRTGMMYIQCMNLKREIKAKDDRKAFRQTEPNREMMRDDSVAPFKLHRDKDKHSSCFLQIVSVN